MTQELVVTQHVAAAPAQVYALWLTPQGLSRWWWVTTGDTTYDVDGGTLVTVTHQVAEADGVEADRQGWARPAPTASSSRGSAS